MILPHMQLPASLEIGVVFSICCLLFQDVFLEQLSDLWAFSNENIQQFQGPLEKSI